MKHPSPLPGPDPRRTARDAEARDAGPRLTPAEVHASRRSAPLTREQFKELRRMAEQGISPLRRL